MLTIELWETAGAQPLHRRQIGTVTIETARIEKTANFGTYQCQAELHSDFEYVGKAWIERFPRELGELELLRRALNQMAGDDGMGLSR